MLEKKMKTIISNLAKMASVAVVAASVVGCSGNAYVENADRNDVVTLGDSIFDLNGQIQANLESWAGETFRNYTQSGAELSGGILAPAVDSQYATAKATDANINTIVMDGGGNDILIPAMLFDPNRCKTKWYRPYLSSKCKALIEDIYVTDVNLLNQMDADGVENVVFLGYYELPRGNTNLNAAVNYGDAYLGYACDTATTANCTFVDPRGHVPAADVESDNIHPTPNGSLTLAGLIWPVLEPLL